MLEAGVDLLTISKLLGHSSFITTMVYLHVRRQHFDRSPSPIDWLPARQCPQWTERAPQPNGESLPQEEQQAPPEHTSAASQQPTAAEAAEAPQPPKTQRRSSGRSSGRGRPAKRRRGRE
jgi:hypothetical protein